MTTAVTDRQSALDFLYSRINYERLAHVPYNLDSFKLDRMRQLLAGIGDPHLALRAVHLAGTKGKGSTAAMIAAVLQGGGYKTGLYTSPHLERLEERFAIDGICLPESEFVSLFAELVPVVERMDHGALSGGSGGGLTFFEITTALGFLYFARHNVDIAVLEVGLGGRLDSTNVCQPEVSVITSISYDHTKQLGNTLTEIAREKGGIIKPEVPVVSGVIDDEPRLVIEEIARQQNAPLLQRGRDFDFANAAYSAETHAQEFDYWERNRNSISPLKGMQISLLGTHQCANAAVAIATLRQLASQNWNISESAIRQGLAVANCSARVQVIGQNPTVIMDVAHNVASIQALVDVLKQQFPQARPTIIFASSRDKDVAGMLRVLLPACETLILTKYVTNPRAMETAELESIAREVASQLPAATLQKIVVAPTPASAWERACQVNSGLICITGSFFLAADMAEVLRQSRTRFEI
ncbi:MAG: bifunctional folylpolyglutamate synthase/dihydrofolate synthase [Planctomycetales bacterium]|nr:bifunctional folylpolyglutamate synthase/dihydrofolate synthase [Planctomycetales bacterium]